MLPDKKIKEIKEYGKSDAKKWFKKDGWVKKENASIGDYYAKLVAENGMPEKIERLKKQFAYTDETLQERAEIYHEAFWNGFKWYENQRVKNEAVLAKYKSIFDDAEALAKSIDVSDIRDGFPCGSVDLYLLSEAKKTDLGKVLRNMYEGDCYSAKVCPWSAYRLPIKIPNYGQCIAFDERVCSKVAEFLTSKGIPAGCHSWID